MPEKNVDPWAGIDPRGKLVIVAGRNPPPALGVRRIGRVTPNAVSPMQEAERRGAVAILYLNPGDIPAGTWDRSRRLNLTRLELFPIVPSAYAAPAMTAVVLARPAAEALLAGERLAAGSDSTLQPVGIELAKRVRVELPLAHRQLHYPYNVVAMIEGSDPALREEYVTIESHLDGAVGSTAQNGDSIYNAADDNATGSAATLAIAEQMMRAPKPKRSLIFIWDSGEERGLWGTRRFVHQPPVPRDPVTDRPQPCRTLTTLQVVDTRNLDEVGRRVLPCAGSLTLVPDGRLLVHTFLAADGASAGSTPVGQHHLVVIDGERLDEQGRVAVASAFALRGFSPDGRQLVSGSYDLTARICGICPVAYQMSACNAMEDAAGVVVDGPIRNLRRLLYCGEWIESHVLHLAMLHAPDFLGYDGAVELARDRRDLVETALRLKKAGNELMRGILEIVQEFSLAAMAQTTPRPRDREESRRRHLAIVRAIGPSTE